MIVDHSTPNVNPALLKAAGVTCVMRYLSGGQSKDITAHERDGLHGLGIDIGLVWETDGRTGPLSGNGGPDGAAAASEAQRLGVPPGVCLFFAVDFDLQPRDLPGVRNYFASLRHYIGGYRLGVYGGLATVEGVHDLVDFGWQTYAWSGGHWSTHAQLQQYQNGATLAGIGVDFNRATAANFGQWSATAQGNPPMAGGSYHPGVPGEFHWVTIDPDKSIRHCYRSSPTATPVTENLGGIAGGSAGICWSPDGSECTIDVIGSDGKGVDLNTWKGGKWGGWSSTGTSTLQLGVTGPKGDPGPAWKPVPFAATISPQ